MAERSFTKEIGKLRLGAGEVFHGEGILAVTKALLQSGVAYVGGYQGAPVSHLMDVLADARDVLDELDVHFEANGSEASAAAMLSASQNYPLRGAVTWKSTVGTNVASDALSNLASAGVIGGTLIIIGEDYGEGASIMQERSHAFAMKSQMWLLDPRPNLPMIVNMVEKGFELSEASNTPVFLQLRIRACHVYGQFEAKDNVAPAFRVRDALAHPTRIKEKIILPPFTFQQEKEKVEKRWPAAVQFIKDNKLNEFFDGDATKDLGIILEGGMYNVVIRSLQLLGLADEDGTSHIPLYVMNVTYPLVDDELIEFSREKKAVLLVEQGQPDYIQQALNKIFNEAELKTRIHGKDVLPMAGEYTGDVVKEGLRRFLEKWHPDLIRQDNSKVSLEALAKSPINREELDKNVTPRPPGLCTGCPERPFFSAMKMLEKKYGEMQVSADIGCNSFGTLPPFNIGNTILGYGLGGASSAAFSDKRLRSEGDKRAIAVMGDGGFWHNGLTSGIASAVYNKSDNVFVIVDNGYAAATGGQYIPSSRATIKENEKKARIQDAVQGVGVKWVRTVQSYDISAVREVMDEAMSTDYEGPKVIVVEGECMLNRQRREKPLVAKTIKGGGRYVKERFYVDSKTCTGDHACIRLSGCPSLTIKPNPDPLREDPVAYVDNSCVGCGVCGEVAHEAVLCPSFSRAELIFNPTFWDRFMYGLRQSIIGFFQNRYARKRARVSL
ncbi:indolepyruvate ferredoxin oxidoreductase subunit alpha [Luteithermobacter gelatinilyticus]|uniref:thiamine pyrophosphate-dependent enzyme n=1 Tax=Luteithermobacter gelatinilyticus TaxID=2582913 RepID=UPI001105F9D7|nr:indolepyruvate ferredoxin oxidoreductase subunit alpha [Luteithermobacter gelatinilyticus]